MTRDLATEGPVPGQERIDVRTEPCSRCHRIDGGDGNG